MVRKSRSWIVVAGSGLHYFVSARFGSFWVFANFSTAERFKYLFHSYEISYHGVYSKETNQTTLFIFSSLVTWTCQMYFTSTVGHGIIAQAPLFVLKSSLYDCYVRLCNYQFYLLISPAHLFHSAQIFSFELKRNTIQILCR